MSSRKPTIMSRRACLQGLGVMLGAAAGSRLLPGFLPTAAAAPNGAGKSAVVSIFFEGGFNAIFSSADSFTSSSSFSVTPSNVVTVGNGLVVDKGTIGTLPAWALGHMAAIGNHHGAIDHVSAQKNNFLDASSSQSFVLQLAGAIGGQAAYKAVALGDFPPGGPPPASSGGLSLQLLRTMSDVSTALGVGPIDYDRPARNRAATAASAARAMSQNAFGAKPASLSLAKQGYDTLVSSLGELPLDIDVNAVASAYGTTSGASLADMPSMLAAAELMLRAGTNVVTMTNTGWDTHGDRTGTTVRQLMSSNIIPALTTFLTRLQSDPTLAAQNVSVILHGDFARSLPDSDHAPALSALVIGPNVRVGTTGHVTPNVTFATEPGASMQMWSYMAALSKVPTNPFGANPHDLVL
jgi:Protein of unknown function (DUF1501)